MKLHKFRAQITYKITKKNYSGGLLESSSSTKGRLERRDELSSMADGGGVIPVLVNSSIIVIICLYIYLFIFVLYRDVHKKKD